jgi:predicted transposase YdaD
MRRKNDILWKGMLEEVFDDLLRFVFKQAEEVFDLKRGFEFLDKELSEICPEPDREPNTRFVDKLVKVFTKDGNEEWLLVHLEVQGYPDRQFPERMFQYYYRIFDRYRRPVTAIAIFTGTDGKSMPDRYEHHFLGTHHVYKYNTLCVTEYSDELLLESDNPFALVVMAAKKALLAGKIPEFELVGQKLLVAKLLYKKGLFSKRKIEGILTFLNNYVLFEKQETNLIFMKELDIITGKAKTMGIIEQLAEIRAQEGHEMGLEEGRVESSRLFVGNLLQETDFSIEKIASLANVSVDFVKEVKGHHSA